MTKLVGRRQFLIAAAVLLAGSVARADDGDDDDDDDDDDDHDQARRALEEGRIRPLFEIIAHVEEELGGRVVGVDLERRRGGYVYELKLLTPSGRLREVSVDAVSAEVLKDEGD